MESKFRIMEVCGTHTHAIMNFGLKEYYGDTFELISGPGCPVCVTSQSDIDRLLRLCDDGVRLYTFSDLMKVPGTNGNLRNRRATGADVREIYSPLEVLEDLKKNPVARAVFVAIGFETTAPLIAALVEETINRGIENLFFYNLLKLIPPAMKIILDNPKCKIDGFLCPGHVSAIIGALPYKFIVESHKKPCVIAGFKQNELIVALDAMKDMLLSKKTGLVNAYSSVVKKGGNPLAIGKIMSFFESSDAEWRGLGKIENSGLKLKNEFMGFDALKTFSLEALQSEDPCPCGLVISGEINPRDCAFFGKKCTPENPVGPCMVSSEGACHAEYLYQRW